jgi:hypothetical protein
LVVYQKFFPLPIANADHSKAQNRTKARFGFLVFRFGFSVLFSTPLCPSVGVRSDRTNANTTQRLKRGTTGLIRGKRGGVPIAVPGQSTEAEEVKPEANRLKSEHEKQ